MCRKILFRKCHYFGDFPHKKNTKYIFFTAFSHHFLTQRFQFIAIHVLSKFHGKFSQWHTWTLPVVEWYPIYIDRFNQLEWHLFDRIPFDTDIRSGKNVSKPMMWPIYNEKQNITHSLIQTLCKFSLFMVAFNPAEKFKWNMISAVLVPTLKSTKFCKIWNHNSIYGNFPFRKEIPWPPWWSRKQNFQTKIEMNRHLPVLC